jgi:hypothetical protein
MKHACTRGSVSDKREVMSNAVYRLQEDGQVGTYIASISFLVLTKREENAEFHVR